MMAGLRRNPSSQIALSPSQFQFLFLLSDAPATKPEKRLTGEPS